jgi:hypothetical protein
VTAATERITVPAPLPRRAQHADCRCGKRGWTTKHDADQVVVNAKILRHLHHNNRRREQRSYRCLTDPTLWHVTSQSVRDTHRPEPVPAVPAEIGKADLRELVEQLVLDEFNRNTDREWERLLTPERAADVNRVLSAVHQAGLKDGADRRAALAAASKAALAGSAGWTRRQVLAREHDAWKLHWARFQAALVTRKAQAKAALKERNIALSTQDAHVANVKHRSVFALLAQAIAEHCAATPDPSDADRELWAHLANLSVPFRGGESTLTHLLAEGVWSKP